MACKAAFSKPSYQIFIFLSLCLHVIGRLQSYPLSSFTWLIPHYHQLEECGEYLQYSYSTVYAGRRKILRETRNVCSASYGKQGEGGKEIVAKNDAEAICVALLQYPFYGFSQKPPVRTGGLGVSWYF